MANPSILERAESSPESLDAKDKLIFGISIIQTATGQENLNSNEKEELLKNGIALTDSSLCEIVKKNSIYSQQEQILLIQRTFQSLDWDSLDERPEGAKLHLSTLLTFAKIATNPLIDKRLVELRSGIIDGYYDLSAIMLLGKDIKDLPPAEQLEELQISEKVPEKLRDYLISGWVGQIVREVDDEQFGELISYFATEENWKIFNQLTVEKMIILNSEKPVFSLE